MMMQPDVPYSLSNLPEELPLFPLPGTILLPRMALPLNVFELRYKTMVDDVLKSGSRMIGIVQSSVSETQQSDTVGTAGRLIRFAETEDHRYHVTLRGISRFRIREVRSGFTPYLRACVDWTEYESDLQKTDDSPDFSRENFIDLLERFFENEGLRADRDELRSSSEEMLVNSLSMALKFSAQEKQALLEAPSVADRRHAIVALMEITMIGGAGTDVLQ